MNIRRIDERDWRGTTAVSGEFGVWLIPTQMHAHLLPGIAHEVMLIRRRVRGFMRRIFTSVRDKSSRRSGPAPFLI